MSEFKVIYTPPVVELIGVSKPIVAGMEKVMAYRGNIWNTDEIKKDPLALAEFGGRVCYESFDNKKKRSRIDYIKDTALAKQHGSIIEHVWFNLAVLDLPRSSLMELTRHRVGTAYSWRSTRYVDNWVTYACPPIMRGDQRMENLFAAYAETNWECYELQKNLIEKFTGITDKKRIIEGARSILANSVVADGEFSVNLRELLHILKLRSDKGADASMQEFAEQLRLATWPYIKDLVGEDNGPVK